MSVGEVSSGGSAAGHPSARWRSVPELLDAQAATAPDAPAVAFPALEATYSHFAASSVRSARLLRAAGVVPGDRVGVLLREGCEPFVSFAVGAMRIGALCVPINARNKTHELAYVMNHAGLRILLTSREFLELIDEAGAPEACRVVVIGEDPDFESGAELVDADEVVALERHAQPDDPVVLLYTSGTTSDPKGCMLTHAALLAEGENCAGRLGLTSEDRFWTPLALFHVGGWQTLLSAFSRGACFSHAGFFEAGKALDQLERERCTAAFPAFELIWVALLDHPRFGEADLSALRLVMNVAVPEAMERMQERVPHAVQVSCFGLTESCGSMCITDPSSSLHSRTHTSGRPLPGMEVSIRDLESGEECPPGVPGELYFRGVTTFSAYYANPQTTAEVIDANGWVRTGDILRWEEDGTVAFMGRLKDMLKVGGENVSVAEIEGYLITHPAVAVVAVVGAPDGRYQEVPAAFVQLIPGGEATEGELIDYCIGRIATYKVPRYVRFIEEFPATATAKIQKFVLRERIAAELVDRGITEAPKPAARR